IVQVALQYALLQAVWHEHVCDAAVKGEHAPMTAEPVAALHVLGRARIQHLAEAKHGDEHPGLVDLPGLKVKPLDRITSVIDFHAFAGGELTSGAARLSVLRELTIKLLPKVRVGRQVLGPLLPQELQRVAESEIVDERWPIDLQ